MGTAKTENSAVAGNGDRCRKDRVHTTLESEQDFRNIVAGSRVIVNFTFEEIIIL